ncbi:MAG: DUF3710 domain-containing protein, partial [Acidothermaceae bacterium]
DDTERGEAEEAGEADDGDAAGEASSTVAAGSGGVGDDLPARRRPLDESEAADDGTVMPRLDLGSMRVPVFSDMEVRVELNDQKQPVAASLLHAGSAVQLLAFAAPRNDGIWDDVRAEIAESVRVGGGQVDEAEGPFGAELRVQARAEVQPGQFAEQKLRFVGFDGPRWFVRGVFSGPAATNPQQAAPLEAVIMRVVIARGEEPMAPRDALPLRLPTDVVGMPQPPEPQQPSIDPFVRGPEITEIQ